MADSPILIPGEVHMNMALKAWQETAKYILAHQMKPGDKFTIEATDRKKLVIHLK